MRLQTGLGMIGIAVLGALTLPVVDARANDSVAGFGVGGLELRTTDVVRMVREDLRITPDQIDVRYVFRNETDHDATLIVAFPLPPVGGEEWLEGYNLPRFGRLDYVGFQTLVDGEPVVMTPDHRITLDGIDRTTDFEAIGAHAVAVHGWETLDSARRSWTPEQNAALRDQGFVDDNGRPRWVLQSTYWREQVFPAQTHVVVEHRYTPVSGGSVESWFPAALEPNRGPEYRAMIETQRARYCPEPEIEQAMRAQLAGETGVVGQSMFGSRDVSYILTTGAGWRGPIGQFNLVVEAPGAWDFVFLCLPGKRRISHSRIEFSAENFVPTQELEVYFARAFGESIDAEGHVMGN